VSDLNDFGFNNRKATPKKKEAVTGPRCQRCGKGVHLFFTTLLCDKCLDWEIEYLRAQNHGGGAKSWMESR